MSSRGVICWLGNSGGDKEGKEAVGAGGSDDGGDGNEEQQWYDRRLRLMPTTRMGGTAATVTEVGIGKQGKRKRQRRDPTSVVVLPEDRGQ
ncbi:hypothetical protein GW17_00050425 [Ensete ventricosum]|nr:hypothetical protein GW17_00050425 [Ensete ventricosum]